MRRFIVVNAKGGCGKSTVATNLAAAFASQGYRTALLDYDPQYSSLAWLKARSPDSAPILGVAAYEPQRSTLSGAWQLKVPRPTQRVVVDTPAGLRATDLVGRLQPSDTLIVPIAPSAIDIRATSDFIRDLLLIAKVRYQQRQLVIVANRTRRNRESFKTLTHFLESLRIPVIAHLSDSQAYIEAAERGLGVCELPNLPAEEQAAWTALTGWLQEGMADTPSPPDLFSAAAPRPAIPAAAPVTPVAPAVVPAKPVASVSRIPYFVSQRDRDDTRH